MNGQGKLLIVGASGFIGRALVELVAERSLAAVALSRHGERGQVGTVRLVRVPEYDDLEAIAPWVAGREIAIIVAGRAHVMTASAADDEAAFHHGNCEVPLAVAEALADAGGRRIVYVSSVAVHGTPAVGQRFRESDLPAPVNAYGRSKLCGEEALRARCAQLGLELVIVRPPMVHGPDAPGHFGQLLRAAQRGIPLPLGAVRNCRSLIGVRNLADMLVHAALHPAAAGRTFLVSDGEDLSTAEIAVSLYAAAGHSGRLLSIPPGLLKALLRLVGRSATAARLFDDLVVDASLATQLLQWQPPLPAREGLERSVRDSVK